MDYIKERKNYLLTNITFFMKFGQTNIMKISIIYPNVFCKIGLGANDCHRCDMGHLTCDMWHFFIGSSVEGRLTQFFKSLNNFTRGFSWC